GHVARFNRSADCTQADPGSLLAGCVRELDGASAARTILSVGAIAAGAGLLIAGTWFVLDANRSRPDRNAELACGGGPGDLGIACGLQF
ncbi:MAG TPA: hypothetical protein VGI70_11670, partial [Polyangiales bacterium]